MESYVQQYRRQFEANIRKSITPNQSGGCIQIHHLKKACDSGLVEAVLSYEKYIEFANDIKKAFNKHGDIEPVLKAKKDLSKLVPMIVVDKKGHRRRVWVKPAEAKKMKQKSSPDQETATEAKKTMPEDVSDGKHKELYGISSNTAVEVKTKEGKQVGELLYWRKSPSVQDGYCVVKLPNGKKVERVIGSITPVDGNNMDGSHSISDDAISDNLQSKADEETAPMNIFNTDVNKRFDTMSKMVQAVGRGYQKSLIIYGTGGTGKTYTTTKELEKLGKVPFDEDEHMIGSENYDYISVTGKVTPAALYRILYEHNGKQILFDDCDSFLKDDDAVNVLKGALDTSGDGTVNWQSSAKIKDSKGEEMPKRFKFKGSAIFISNLSADKVPQPLKSRSLRVDMSMSKEQTIDRINFILDKIDFKLPGTTMEDKREVLNYLKENLTVTDDVNVRTLKSLLVLKKVNEGKDWGTDAQNFLLSKGQ